MSKFKRAGRPRVNVEDDRGRVYVMVALKNYTKGGVGYQKGNITKSVTIDGTKVSEVFAAIEKALF